MLDPGSTTPSREPATDAILSVALVKMEVSASLAAPTTTK